MCLAKLESLDSIRSDISFIKNNLCDLNTAFTETNRQLSEACEEIADIKAKQQKYDRMESEIELLKQKTAQLEKQVNEQNSYSRRENLLIKGIPEVTDKNEDCCKVAQDVFQRLELGPFQLHRFHRLGKYNKQAKQPRPIIVRFVCYQDKLAVLKKRTSLKGTNIFIEDDLLPEVAARRAALYPVVKHIRTNNPDAKISLIQDKLSYEGKTYTVENVNELPFDKSAIGTEVSGDQVYFSGEYTPISNLYPCDLMIDDKLYHSIEHFFQFQKCLEHKKLEIAMKTLAAKTAMDALGIGKKENASEKWNLDGGQALMQKALEKSMPVFKPFVLSLIIMLARNSLRLAETHFGA